LDFDRALAPCDVDAQALQRALSNLVANACDAMPRGGRLNLSVQAGQLPDGRPAFTVSVTDSGPGMTRDLMQCAVRPFFTTKSHDPLAGLGLSAVDGFARQMGGSLSLRSSAGCGLTATMLLPQSAPASMT
jgi:signal transduction histidine kinase